ncbi:CDK5 regulatory subunit-associated protein Cdk5rap3 [Acrasis kona]|uniref:CDK5 regulatory subunit-associated protein Cdk5rap3 n=1 Tax=Acrasis kona TaxID=1008807 RepID=A0AAW2YJ75_9EUKA
MVQAYKDLVEQCNKNLEGDQQKNDIIIKSLIERIEQKSKKNKKQNEPTLNYKWASEITNLLNKVDADQTGYLFGLVGGSKRLKSWRQITSTYEKNNLHLVELSLKMTDNVKYAIPALFRTSGKYRKQIDELDQKEQDWHKTVRDLRRKFLEECEMFGIQTSSKSDLYETTKRELPHWYNKIYEACNDAEFKKSINYYISFVSFMSGKDAVADFNTLPVLRFLSGGGRTTKQWVAHQNTSSPDQEESVAHNEPFEVKEHLNNDIVQIDFGDDFNYDGFDENISVQGGFEIDFGEDESEGYITKHELMTPSLDTDQSILNQTDSRNLFVNDLTELYAFVTQRISEKQDTSAVSTTVETQIFQNADEEIRNENMDQLNRFKDAITLVNNIYNDPKFKQLIMIQTSKSFVERVCKSLQQRQEVMGRINESLSGVAAKRESLKEAIVKLEPSINHIINKTRRMQKELQSHISKLVKGRPVNILGDINIVLGSSDG